MRLPYSAFNLDSNRSIDYAQRAFSLLEIHGTNRQMSIALLHLGNSYRVVGDFVRARQCYDHCAELGRSLGDDAMLARYYGSIAILYASQERFVEAIVGMERALVLAQSSGARTTLATTYSNLGTIYLKSGQHRQALPILEQALKMGHEMGEKRRIAIATGHIAGVYEKLGDLPKALALAEDSLQQHREIGDPRRVSLGLSTKAQVLARMGRFEEAAMIAERGLPHLVENFTVGSAGLLHGWTGVIYTKLGRFEEALQQCLALLDTVDETNVNYVPGLNYLIVALVLMSTNEAEQKGRLASLLSEIGERTETPNEIAANLAAAVAMAEAAVKFELGIMARCEAARYWLAENEPVQARQLLAEGKALAQSHDLITSVNEIDATCIALGLVLAEV